MDGESALSRVRARLAADTLSVDMKFSLFVGAVLSYRHDTVLRPFPPAFMDGEEKNHSRLMKATEVIPKFADIRSGPIDPQFTSDPRLTPEATDLLDWLLDRRSFDLRTCPNTKDKEIRQLTGQTVTVPEPDHIFQVLPSTAATLRFEERATGRPVMYAYHGSRLENFFSILNYGLHSHMSKNALFGEGTYLSSELSVSMPYCPSGQAWQNSILGDSLACIAVCALIDDEGVNCHVKDQRGEVNRTRSQVAGSEGGAIPEKYYIVQNNELLQVQYVLVYASRTNKTQSLRQLAASPWWSRHKFELMIVFYAFLLVAIGLMNSRTAQRYLKKIATWW